LGAVAEFERAKIIERTSRGWALRLAQGQSLGCGVHTFGYHYIRKSPTSLPQMVINEKEAEIVRHAFETYATERIGLDKIAQQLEDAGTLTKKGNTVWRRSFLKTMLCNETYLGVKYFNQMRVIRQYANPIYVIEHSTKKTVSRGREDWIGVNVPAIISRELFDRVQKRLEDNRKTYRNPREPQLLSNMIKCGECGSSGFALRRWEHSQRKSGPALIVHVGAYKCNWTFQGRLHTDASGIKRCHNPQNKVPTPKPPAAKTFIP
jgi:site-specific DNA recombinase